MVISIRREAALNHKFLQTTQITHVLNAAEGKREKNGTVDTNKVLRTTRFLLVIIQLYKLYRQVQKRKLKDKDALAC